MASQRMERRAMEHDERKEGGTMDARTWTEWDSYACLSLLIAVLMGSFLFNVSRQPIRQAEAEPSGQVASQVGSVARHLKDGKTADYNVGAGRATDANDAVDRDVWRQRQADRNVQAQRRPSFNRPERPLARPNGGGSGVIVAGAPMPSVGSNATAGANAAAEMCRQQELAYWLNQVSSLQTQIAEAELAQNQDIVNGGSGMAEALNIGAMCSSRYSRAAPASCSLRGVGRLRSGDQRRPSRFTCPISRLAPPKPAPRCASAPR